MAAVGMTNRAIADALFVTAKTVEYHLANTYRKLCIGSRKEFGPLLRHDGKECVRPDSNWRDLRLERTEGFGMALGFPVSMRPR
jgi:hypothetical protein